MKNFIQGNLTNIFKNRDYTDSKTGETSEGKYQLQFLTTKDMGDGLGEQMVLEKISIPESLYPKYKDQIGKEVTVLVRAMATKDRKVIYYGVEE